MPLVEKRYAQALMELSSNNPQSISAELEYFVAIYKSDKELSNFLLDPRIKADNKIIAIRNIFTDSLSENVLNFILLLITKQRISYVPEIYEQLVHLISKKLNFLDMRIITAQPLEEQHLNSIKEKFRNKYNASGVKATEIVDPSIIGGIKVIIGDKVYDGSIKGRIESLTELVSI